MPYNALYQNEYAVHRPTRKDDLSFLAQLVCGHLMHYLSTPESFLTWSPTMATRIQSFLTRAANKRHMAKPGDAIRTLLVIARYHKENPDVVAFDDDAEVFFYATYTQVARHSDVYLSDGKALSFIPGLSWETVQRFAYFSPHIRERVEKAMAPAREERMEADVMAALDFYLGPLVDEVVRRGDGGDAMHSCLGMPLSTPLKPLEWGGVQRSLYADTSYESRMSRHASAVVEENGAADDVSLSEVSHAETSITEDPSHTSLATSMASSNSKTSQLSVGHALPPSLVVDGISPSSNGTRFYSAAENMDHVERTMSTETDLDDLFSLLSFDDVPTSYPSVPPEKHPNPLKRWSKRTKRSRLGSNSVAQDSRKPFVGGVVHVVAVKLGVSRARAKSSKAGNGGLSPVTVSPVMVLPQSRL